MSSVLAPLLQVHVVATGIDERMSVPLDRTLALGRDADCDVALPSATVSRKHLSLFMRDGRLVIRDHSSNGTRVNGEPLHLAVRELDGCAALEIGPYSIGLQLERDEPFERAPFELLLDDPEVSELELIEASSFQVERTGRNERVASGFASEHDALAALEQWLAQHGVDRGSSPLLDLHLADGTRVLAMLPPVALRGPWFCIRKPAACARSLDQQVVQRMLSPELASLLVQRLSARCGLLICGARGTGKTSLLGSLLAALPQRERIVLVERAPELSLMQLDLLALIPPADTAEPAQAIEAAELLGWATRMRPERIVLGECRAAEALALLRSGEDAPLGWLSTLVAHSPEAALQRLESLCRQTDRELTRMALHRCIAASLQLVVQLTRAADGTRQVSRIGEVSLDARGKLSLRDLFCSQPTSAADRVEASEPGEVVSCS